eukprot:Skav234277  [mRNA]  locus=scaffold1464:1221099:1224675:+ [translate_table: standard]
MLLSRFRFELVDVEQMEVDSSGLHLKPKDGLKLRVMANHCYGRVAKSTLAAQIGSRPIWLTRAGAGAPETKGGSTADEPCPSADVADRSQASQQFAKRLADFVKTRAGCYWERSGKPEERLPEPSSVVGVFCFGVWGHEMHGPVLYQ